MSERVPQPFVSALADLTQWLEAAGIPAMIVGGIAASILGRPRATRDIGALAVAADDQWARLLDSSKVHGILARIENPLEFARRTRVLLLRHTESGIDIDVILSGLPLLVPRSEGRAPAGVQTLCALETNDVEAVHAALESHGVSVSDIGRKGTARTGLFADEVRVSDPVPPSFNFETPMGTGSWSFRYKWRTV